MDEGFQRYSVGLDDVDFVGFGGVGAPSALISEQKADSEYTKLIPVGIEISYKGLWKHGNVAS